MTVLPLSAVPAHTTAGIERGAHRPGRSIEVMTVQRSLTDAAGAASAGVLGVLADTALGRAVHSLVDGTVWMATTHLHLAFLRPLEAADDRFVATCDGALAPERRHGSAWGEIRTGSGQVVARAGLGAVLGIPRPEPSPPDGRTPELFVGGWSGAAASDQVGTAPVDVLLGRRVIRADVHGAEVTFSADASFANSGGGLHGGFGFLFGERLFEPVVAAIDPRLRITDVRAVFLRAIAADSGTVRGIATTLHCGRRLVVLHGTIEDRAGRPAVVVDATYLAPPTT